VRQCDQPQRSTRQGFGAFGAGVPVGARTLSYTFVIDAARRQQGLKADTENAGRRILGCELTEHVGIELVVTDLDGTLWDRDGRVDTSTRAALSELDRRGIRVLVATGRRRRSAHRALTERELALAAIVGNGSAGYDTLDGEPWCSHTFDQATAAGIVAAFASIDHQPVFETNDLIGDVIIGDRPSVPIEFIRENDCREADFDGPLPTPTTGAVAIVERERASALRRVIEDADLGALWVHLSAAYPDTAVAKVTPFGRTKWLGAVEYATRHGVATDRILAVGDDVNDVPMLQAAGMGLCMAVGAQEAIDAAAATIATWADLVDHTM
jgi:hydroxymethylpyrimidine pyrophosphatase-like HAD family hydrolase